MHWCTFDIHGVGIIVIKAPCRVYHKSLPILYAHDKTLRFYFVITTEFETTTHIIFNTSITLIYL